MYTKSFRSVLFTLLRIKCTFTYYVVNVSRSTLAHKPDKTSEWRHYNGCIYLSF